MLHLGRTLLFGLVVWSLVSPTPWISFKWWLALFVISLVSQIGFVMQRWLITQPWPAFPQLSRLALMLEYLSIVQVLRWLA